MDEAEPEFEIVQKINPARLIQINLDGINTAPSPSVAALHVANLYLNLKGIRRIDSQFDQEWRQVLEGNFMEYAANDAMRPRLSWTTVWRARELLQDLMERRGMSFQAQLTDPLAVERGELELRAMERRDQLAGRRPLHGG